jgi:hypothetical protein
MKTFAWLLKNVVLPLAPFLVGAGIRLLHGGELRLSCFSPTELAFSMAMMFMILSSTTAKLTNPIVRDALNNGFYLGVIFFLALFAIGLFLDVEALSARESFLEAARARTNAGQVLLPSDIPPAASHDDLVFARIRLTTIFSSIFAVLLALFVGRKYDLMDT